MHWQERLNLYGKEGIPCFFLIDYAKRSPCVYPLESLPSEIRFAFGTPLVSLHQSARPLPLEWKKEAIPFEVYHSKVRALQEEIAQGNCYLANLTQPTRFLTQASLGEIYEAASAPFKLLYEGKFVCFSPEPFLEIQGERARTFPMKGTILNAPGAKESLLSNPKELAEHVMVVDLLRNDMGSWAQEVRVDSFREFSLIRTWRGEIWQTSSIVSARAPRWRERLGDILDRMTPAGSITGTPKRRCCEILEHLEEYERGCFTGVAGVFDGESLRSFVLIRYIESSPTGELFYKSGGGITIDSDPFKEYEEMLEKVYVPIF